MQAASAPESVCWGLGDLIAAQLHAIGVGLGVVLLRSLVRAVAQRCGVTSLLSQSRSPLGPIPLTNRREQAARGRAPAPDHELGSSPDSHPPKV